MTSLRILSSSVSTTQPCSSDARNLYDPLQTSSVTDYAAVLQKLPLFVLEALLIFNLPIRPFFLLPFHVFYSSFLHHVKFFVAFRKKLRQVFAEINFPLLRFTSCAILPPSVVFLEPCAFQLIRPFVQLPFLLLFVTYSLPFIWLLPLFAHQLSFVESHFMSFVRFIPIYAVPHPAYYQPSLCSACFWILTLLTRSHLHTLLIFFVLLTLIKLYSIFVIHKPRIFF